jgi:transposase-like protein
LKEVDASLASGKPGAVAALLRREGIYSSHLATWRQQFAARGAAGLAPKKPGRKPKADAKDKEIAELKKRTAALERKLYIAEKLIDLQKKASALLAVALPNDDENSWTS